MKKILACFLSVLMVLTCIIIPGMVVSAATPEYLEHYNFDMSQEGIYDYVTTQLWTKGFPNGIADGKVTFKPDSVRDERSVWPVISPGAAGYESKSNAVYEEIERNGEKLDTLALTTANYTSFVPIMSDGKPFELKPGTEYTVNISYYVTGNNKTSAPAMYVAGGLLYNTYFSGIAELGQNRIPVWDNGYLGRPFSSEKITIAKGTTTTSEDGTSVTDVTDTVKNTLVTKELTFTTMPAPADGDTSYSYDPEENVYTVAASDSSGNALGDYSISNYFHIIIWGSTTLKLNITHLEITSDDYVPQTTVEYIVDGEVVETETVEQGTDYAISYIHPHTAEKRFAGWYYDEALTDEVKHNTTSISTDGIDTLRLYAKMVEYETNITMPVNNKSWAVGYYPYIAASGAYMLNIDAKRTGSTNYVSADENKLTVKGYLTFALVARNPESNDFLVAKPGAEYKLTLKYKVNKVTDSGDYYMCAGYDIAEGSTIAGSKTFAYTADLVTDNNVSSEIKEFSQNIVIGERSGGDPFLGFRIIASEGFEVEIYELKVEEVISEDLSTGEFLVTKNADNRTTYKVEFDYKLNETLTEDVGIGFKTTDASGNAATYVEAENTAIYTISADKAVDEWNHATAFVTTDMLAEVTSYAGTDDTLTALNSMLYAYIIGEENYSKISVKDITAKNLGDVVGKGTDYILTEEVAAATKNQALRFSFSYVSTTGSDITIDGVTYTVKNRGFIYLNGQAYALDNRYAGDINLTTAKAEDTVFHSEKSTGLENCWEYDNGTGTLYYSTYIKGFAPDDEKELMIRGYVTVECDGQTFTLYSDTFNRSVDYMTQ